MTIGESYKPAMEIKTQEEADKYFEMLVDYFSKIRTDLTKEQVRNIQRQNLGYFAGYYDDDTRRRVEILFKAKHPIFGGVDEVGVITANIALAHGYKIRKEE